VNHRFVSEAIVPDCEGADPSTLERGEPSLPRAFTWREERLVVAEIRATERSTRIDRGEQYLARHWFRFGTPDGREAVVYFDRQAKKGRPRWFLYTIAAALTA
jgi:hypothetical protein